jgi:hypothetical protein
VAGLNFEPYNKMPQSLGLANGGRIVMVDKNGIKIADSDINETLSISNQTMQQSSSTNLRFKNALNGNTGTVAETPEGSKVIVFLKPVKAIQNDRGHSSHKARLISLFLFRGRMRFCRDVFVLMLGCRSGFCLWISVESIKATAENHTPSHTIKPKTGYAIPPICLFLT